ncbi:hypothetical protein PVK06_028903 [Gossypium arboreum]|uniref:RNase H type-1 domain-containing protein n=1 Tax=Gossypium arboreum TaxID=29729 RepID=A0ABR0P576_GOSAR|nr:hypothetical protein PVK06_028903 [Gossypium arboreum]
MGNNLSKYIMEAMENLNQMSTEWECPRVGWFKLNTDGGVDVNFENATVSGLIRCSNGNWVLGYGWNMGVHLILDAKLQAIIDGMNMAWDIGMCHLIVDR